MTEIPNEKRSKKIYFAKSLFSHEIAIAIIKKIPENFEGWKVPIPRFPKTLQASVGKVWAYLVYIEMDISATV